MLLQYKNNNKPRAITIHNCTQTGGNGIIIPQRANTGELKLAANLHQKLSIPYGNYNTSNTSGDIFVPNSIGDGWVVNADNTYTFDGSQSEDTYSYLQITPDSLTVGDTYTLYAVISNYSGTGNIGFAAIGFSATGRNRSSDGIISTTQEAVGTKLALYGTNTMSCTVSLVSVLHHEPIYSTDVQVTSTISCWGSSTTAGTDGTSYPNEFPDQEFITLNNFGVGGETSTEIQTRFAAGTAYHDDITIIQYGANNYAYPDTVKADIASAVGMLDHNRYLILGLHNADYESNYIGRDIYNWIMQLNSDLSELYGNHFVDYRAYLLELYDPTDAEDVLDYSHGVIPGSLRVDEQHLNASGYVLLAEYIHTRLLELGILRAAGSKTLCHPCVCINGKNNPLIVQPWVAETAIAIGDRKVIDNIWLTCTTAGTTDTTAPIIPTIGGTVTDGTVVWSRERHNFYSPYLNHILCEPSSTNLIPLGSTNLSNQSTTNTTITNEGKIILDDYDSYSITESATSGQHYILATAPNYISVTTDEIYKFSVLLKPNTTQYLQLILSSTGFGTNAFVTFDLVNKTVLHEGTAVLSSSITTEVDDCLLLSFSATSIYTGSVTSVIAFSDLANVNNRLPVYTGSGQNVVIVNRQIEHNPNYTTAPLISTTSSATKAASILSCEFPIINDFVIILSYIPVKLIECELFSIYTDTNNYLSITLDSNNYPVLTKCISGSSTSLTIETAITSDQNTLVIKLSSITGVDFWSNGNTTSNSSISDINIGSVYINRLGTAHGYCDFTIFDSILSDVVCLAISSDLNNLSEVI